MKEPLLWKVTYDRESFFVIATSKENAIRAFAGDYDDQGIGTCEVSKVRATLIPLTDRNVTIEPVDC